MEHLTNKLTCLCCGKVSTVKASKPNISDALVECGHCGYEHIVEIRAGKLARVQTTGEDITPEHVKRVINDWCFIEG